LIKAAAIENRLIGSVKLANEEKDADYRVDKDVKLMGNQENGGDSADPRAAAAAAGSSAAKVKLPTPAAASPEAVQQFEKMQQRPLKTTKDSGSAQPQQ
jgi:hypothetical protein